MNKKYLNKFNLISYNLHNGNVSYKILKNGGEEEEVQTTAEEEDNNYYRFIIEDIPKEYWVIKNKNNKFKILIKSQDIEINSLIYIKAGPFSSIEAAKDALTILSNWRFGDVI